MALLVVPGAADAEARRVLLLHSFGPHFAPWNFFSAHFREELTKRSPVAIDLYEASLEVARYARLDEQGAFVDYLRSLYAGMDLNLVVAMGAPATRFAQQYRSRFFPSTPLLIAGPEQRIINEAALTSNDAVVAVKLDFSAWIEHILRVLPETRHIAWAVGASSLERSWTEAFRQASQPFTNRVTFEWFNDLSFDEMLKRATVLPPRSAIFYVDVRVDARGVTLDSDTVLPRLHQVANAPIFTYVDGFFGHGIVGGPLLSSKELGSRIAAIAVRILGGESAGNIKTAPLGVGSPVYDSRELQRWNISEARLPPGSAVLFREPTEWEKYRWQLITAATALLLQMGLIAWLLLERYRRQTAERESRRRSLEVMHLNLAAETGALSASFAHEVGQPLTAITLGAESAELLLAANPPDIAKLKGIIGDIGRAGLHARGVIKHLGKLLKRKSVLERQEFDLNNVIADAMHILSPEARRRSVTLRAEGVQQPLIMLADPVHVQQVILILAINGMDAMARDGLVGRRLVVGTELQEDATVIVSVSDSGPGIPHDKLGKIFETFYTTKEQGTGLGLSIARTIVELYGGKIWAENCAEGGAVFRFMLPLCQRSPPRNPLAPGEIA